MPRRKPREQGRSSRPLREKAVRYADWQQKPWSFYTTTGIAGKTYKCLGCGSQVGNPTEHILIEFQGSGFIDPAQDHTHWHMKCWNSVARNVRDFLD